MLRLKHLIAGLRDRVKETCKMAKEELAKVQTRNQLITTEELVTENSELETASYSYCQLSTTS